jgi:hypothetical protein
MARKAETEEKREDRQESQSPKKKLDRLLDRYEEEPEGGGAKTRRC